VLVFGVDGRRKYNNTGARERRVMSNAMQGAPASERQ